MSQGEVRVDGEELRLEVLGKYRILDTVREPAFDEIVALVARLCDCPIVALCFVDRDRLWFKAEYGLGFQEVDRHEAFCNTVLAEKQAVVVGNALEDHRFCDSQYVLGDLAVRYYVGVPLRTPSGEVLGTLSIVNQVPREPNPAHVEILSVFAEQVMAQLELRLRIDELEKERAARMDSENKLRLISQVTNDVLYDWDMVKDIMVWNEGFENQFGYSVTDRAPGLNSWSANLHSDDWDSVMRSFENAIESGTDYWTEEYRFVHKDGSDVYVLDRGYFLKDASGKPVRMIGGMINVTADRVAEVALQRQAALLEHAPNAISVQSLDGSVMFWNPAAESLFGWSDDEARGRPLHELTGESRRSSESRTEKLLEEGFVAEDHEGFSRNGNYLSIATRSVILRDAKGEPQSVLSISNDVTERRNQEQQLRLFEICFQQLKDLVVITDRGDDLEVGHKILYVNDAFCKRTGYSREEVLGRNPRFLQGPKSSREVLARMKEAISRWEPCREELINYTKTGEEFWLEIEIVPVAASCGTFSHWVAIERDITARKRDEEVIRENTALIAMASKVGKLGAWVVEVPSMIHRWSEEARAIHEVSQSSQFTVDELLEFYSPEVREYVKERVTLCIRHGIPFDIEAPLTTGKQRNIWVRSIGEAVRDSEGRIVRVEGAIQDITERLEYEQSLAASEERFRSLSQSLPMTVWSASPDGTLDFASDRFYLFSGASPDVPVGEVWASVIHPEDLGGCLIHWNDCIANKKPYVYEFRGFGVEDQEYRWFRAQAEPVFDAHGTLIKWYGATVDIHETRGLQQQALDLADRLRTTLESITDAFITLDREFHFTYLNPEAERLLERSKHELLGKKFWSELVGTEDLAFGRCFREASQSGETVKFEEFYLPLNRYFELHCYPSAEGLAVYFRDVTEQRLAKERMEEQSSLLTNAQRIGKMGSWIYHYDPERLIWSEATCDLFGISSADFGGTVEEFLKLVVPSDRWIFHSETRGGLSVSGLVENRYRIERTDGTIRWLHERGTTEFDELGRPVRQIGMVMDVTDQHESQLALQTINEELEARVLARTLDLQHATEEMRIAKETADNANRSKSEFLSRMSHELRTPMNAILGFGQLLEMSKLTNEHRDFVSHILKAGDHLISLINDVLDLSRVEIGELRLSLEPVDVAELLAGCVSLMMPVAKSANIQVSVEYQDQVYAYGDSIKLRQVFLNLLSNAIKYNVDGGRVDILVSYGDSEQLRIEFRDTGIGFSAGDLERIFRPFERLGSTTEVEGTGLGLSLSRSFIEAMGGTLTANSLEGPGASFIIEMRQSTHPLRSNLILNSGIKSIHPHSVSPITLLLIEDNLTNTALIESVFAESAEFNVLTCHLGFEGLEVARAIQPDIILLDLHLPDIDGKSVLKQLKADEELRSVPVVIVSADAHEKDRETLLQMGAFRYLTKPFLIEDLIRSVEDGLQVGGLHAE